MDFIVIMIRNYIIFAAVFIPGCLFYGLFFADLPRTIPTTPWTECTRIPRPVAHSPIGTISTGSDCLEDLIQAKEPKVVEPIKVEPVKTEPFSDKLTKYYIPYFVVFVYLPWGILYLIYGRIARRRSA